jgi:cytochrome c
MTKLILIAAVASALTLAACGQKASDQTEVDATNVSTPAATEIASADTAPTAFSQCSVCHKIEAGAPNGVGPNLHGVYGTKAGGDINGYQFSEAMKTSGLVWDDATLDKYLANPRTAVPGTKMSYGGMASAEDRKAVIAWMKKNS